MSAPMLPPRCKICFAELHPCYRFNAAELCEDCQADEWNRLQIIGHSLQVKLFTGGQSGRQKRAPGTDKDTAEYLKQFYSK